MNNVSAPAAHTEHHWIYSGQVGHCRYQPTHHAFHYTIFLIALDLDYLDTPLALRPWFAINKSALMRFNPRDYLYREDTLNRHSAWRKVLELGGIDYGGRVVFLGQVRCLGVYFSPVNFYYCHNQQDELVYLIAEVSNTPWNERHCYLVDAKQQASTEKAFHVSPFMSLAMDYHWRFSRLAPVLHLQISNHDQQQGHKLFDAAMRLEQQAFSKANLRRQWLRIPAMTLKTVLTIYWQALKLYLKKVPYVPHSQKSPAQKS